jgi:hypothetical protein
VQAKATSKHIKEECEFQNTEKGTHIIIKEMADYSTMKSHLNKNNLHYFIFSPNSKKPIKAVIRYLPPETPVEDNSKSREDLSFNVINMRQRTATQRAPNIKIHVETLPLLLVTLT